jgi:hypothetical protein
MNDADMGYLFDLLEEMNKRIIRTESKLSALMTHLKLSPQGGVIDQAYSGHSKNVRPGAARPASGRPNQR